MQWPIEMMNKWNCSHQHVRVNCILIPINIFCMDYNNYLNLRYTIESSSNIFLFLPEYGGEDNQVIPLLLAVCTFDIFFYFYCGLVVLFIFIYFILFYSITYWGVCFLMELFVLLQVGYK